MGHEIKWFFKLTHDILRPERIALAEAELRALSNREVYPIKNFVDELFEYPLSVFVDNNIRAQDMITRLCFPGPCQGFKLSGELNDPENTIRRLTFFRETFIAISESQISYIKEKLRYFICEFDERMLQKDAVSKEILSPFCQVISKKYQGERIYLFRILSPYILYEYIDVITNLISSAVTVTKEKDVKKRFIKRKKRAKESLNKLLNHLHNVFDRAPNYGRGGVVGILDYIDRPIIRSVTLSTLQYFKTMDPPRLIRPLINIIGLRENETLLDPLAGSGNMLLSAIEMGVNAKGIEIHPLTYMIAVAKCAAYLLKKTADFTSAVVNLLRRIEQGFEELKKSSPDDFYSKIIVEAKKYHNKLDPGEKEKITIDHLTKIILIRREIQRISEAPDENTNSAFKLICQILLSDAITLQFKRKVFNLYHYFERRLSNVVLLRYLLDEIDYKIPKVTFDIINADAREMTPFTDVDGIVTNPPYVEVGSFETRFKPAMSLLDIKGIVDTETFFEKSIGRKMVGKKVDLSCISPEIKNDLKKVQNWCTLHKRERKGLIISQFIADIDKVARQTLISIKPGGYIVIVLGQTYHIDAIKSRLVIDFAELFRKLFESVGFEYSGTFYIPVGRWSDLTTHHWYLVMREHVSSILIMRRPDDQPDKVKELIEKLEFTFKLAKEEPFVLHTKEKLYSEQLIMRA